MDTEYTERYNVIMEETVERRMGRMSGGGTDDKSLGIVLRKR